MLFVLLLLGLFIVQIWLALLKYGRISSFNTYMAKLAAMLQALFLLTFYFFGPVFELFYAAAIITAIDLLEEIILVIILPQWEPNVKGIYWVVKAYNSAR